MKTEGEIVSLFFNDERLKFEYVQDLVLARKHNKETLASFGISGKNSVGEFYSRYKYEGDWLYLYTVLDYSKGDSCTPRVTVLTEEEYNNRNNNK